MSFCWPDVLPDVNQFELGERRCTSHWLSDLLLFSLWFRQFQLSKFILNYLNFSLHFVCTVNIKLLLLLENKQFQFQSGNLFSRSWIPPLIPRKHNNNILCHFLNNSDGWIKCDIARHPVQIEVVSRPFIPRRDFCISSPGPQSRSTLRGGDTNCR